MLTLQQIKENPDKIVERLAVKGFDGRGPIDAIMELDAQRRQLQLSNDTRAAELNKLAASIGALMKQGKKDEAEQAKQQVAALKGEQKDVADSLADTERRMREILLTVPNIPCEAVPAGLSAEDNVVELTGGPMPDLGADAMPHWDLAKKYDLIDFDLGVKITGAGFPVYKGKGAKLQRALIQFFLDQASEAGYLEIQPPYVVNEASGYGTGQLPDKEGQMYYVGEDNLYLIPTAEVPVTNLYRDVILSESQLPVKNCAYSACFRREAGSYGKDVRGLNRLHQFDKVEIVRIEKPENSYAALEEMKAHVQGLLEKLGLPWHILRLCGGDMSFTSAITFDFEVWSGAQKRWLEVSSVSNFETYQANRLKCRYRDADKKTRLCHTLNGSALALPRIMAALLENNQTPRGIVVPECLRRYTGFDIID
ncbi:serine--tRNA ligase [Paramuribaculum intestinale]|uniref:Serine--tRNA ligase n=4 Tax=Paramuribaculum intestinale TaxID=2094151 RepID=A0A2V1IUT7_9BACT|nr:serine--tRNA ligase [Paramuribaculum intestinale]MCX4329092.1 serine--tRNA ligase [Paramuribaculum intestinale]PWB08658.1 serine--tRNA ligase [Paramuribaculum intestinale]PWB10028.1 serine--tRNA ligase [Paramuribaculum intestinale]WLT41716.1 serine--tRNA ligase [Paramuribaculum intestinale]